MRRLLTNLALLCLLPTAVAAQEVHLWEISPGLADFDDADYVVLRVSGICSLDGLALVAEDDSGTSQGCYLRFAGPPPVSDGYILVGSVGVEEAHGLTPDFFADCAGLALSSGRICLVDGSGFLDCVAYGQYTGSNSGWGPPADGLGPSESLRRNQLTGLNSIDWLRSTSSDPSRLLGNRVLPPDGVICGTDGGPPPDGGGTFDPTYLEYPGGGLCPTSTLGATINDGGTDGGTSDAGTIDDGGTTVDGGGRPPPTGGGNSQPYEPTSSCCGISTGQTAVILLPLGLALFFPGFGRRRWRS